MTPSDIFWISVLVLTAVSALGSTTIVVSILLGYRKDYSARLVFSLAFADLCLSVVCFCNCLVNLVRGHLDPDNINCHIQPVTTWYFMEASMMWLTAIAINSYRSVYRSALIEPLSYRAEVITNIICWGCPVVTTLLPIGNTGESYGPRNGFWCSFAEDQKDAQMANLLAYYVPSLLIIGSCYAGIAITIRNFGEGNEETRAKVIKQVKKLFLYVICYFVVWTPLVVSYIYEAATKRYISFVSEILFDNLMHVQGICISKRVKTCRFAKCTHLWIQRGSCKDSKAKVGSCKMERHVVLVNRDQVCIDSDATRGSRSIILTSHS